MSADNENFRGKTSTSSQRTLRYNDFELVHRSMHDKPEYAMDISENDNKSSHKSKSPKGLKKKQQ